MPWKLIAPRPGKTQFWYVRGEFLNIRLDHSTQLSKRSEAVTLLKTWRAQAIRGEFAVPRKAPVETGPLTLTQAATSYMRAGGDGTYLPPILKRWPTKPLADIDQVAIDTLAAELYPKGTAATRNRQVYTPIMAVAKRARVRLEIDRPKGSEGKQSTSWLEPDQAFRLFVEADKLDPEFGLLCRFLTYTGMRLGEALDVRVSDLRLDRSLVYLPDSKNGEPRGCHLPPVLVEAFRDQPPRAFKPVVRNKAGHYVTGGTQVEDAGVPYLERRQEAKLFRYHAGGALRGLHNAAKKAAGLKFPRRQGGFHLFCHTYGSWMHQFGELDPYGLARTGRWLDPDSANRYVHTAASSEALRSDLLPTPKRGQDVEIISLKLVGEK